MNLYQCEEAAKDVGYDRAYFMALFPAGPMRCKWVDAYIGMFEIDADELRGKIFMTKQIDQMFPSLECSEPYLIDDDNEVLA